MSARPLNSSFCDYSSSMDFIPSNSSRLLTEAIVRFPLPTSRFRNAAWRSTLMGAAFHMARGCGEIDLSAAGLGVGRFPGE